MKIFLSIIPILFFACIVQAGPYDPDNQSLILFEGPSSQSKHNLSARWHNLSPEEKKQIENFLFIRLGLSANGKIYLIGAYQQPAKKDQASDKNWLFHFQQLQWADSQLFWSVLVDPEAATAFILYHVNDRFVTHKPMSMKRK